MKRFIHVMSFTLTLLALAFGEAGKPSVFELRLVANSPGADTEAMSIMHQTNGTISAEKEVFHVKKEVLMDQTDIASAQVQQNTATGYHQIEITFTEKGAKLFADTTRQNIGKQLAIVVDGHLLSVPRVMAEVSGGKALITGRFSEQETYELTKKINAAIASE